MPDLTPITFTVERDEDAARVAAVLDALGFATERVASRVRPVVIDDETDLYGLVGKEPAQPMQPVVIDEHGTHRFKANAVVRYLLDHGGLDLNALAVLSFPNDDRVHFHQLIGYSVSGAGDLLYQMPDGVEVDDPAYNVADPGNSDGEVIGRCLDISTAAWKNASVSIEVAAQTTVREITLALQGSPSGKRHESS